jgi:hypothetical protein
MMHCPSGVHMGASSVQSGLLVSRREFEPPAAICQICRHLINSSGVLPSTGVSVRTGVQPEVTGEEGRADLALTYAPFESGLLGRPVTLDEVVQGHVDAYQREIDMQLGLLPQVVAT